MKLIDFFKTKKNILIIASVVLAAAVLIVFTLTGNDNVSVDESATDANINPRYQEIMESSALTEGTSAAAESTTTTSAPATKQETTANTTAPASSAQETTAAIPFATAIAPQTPADYGTQWDLGYLVAIDNPDTSYSCAHVTLTEADRDLLERLCMGEFGSGGFIGACLIAQAVKDAMCFDGYTSVADVIKYCRYTGSTDIGTSNECRQAVRYIFDENHDAVQHRIMYMYNPYMVQSAFHESQNFILSYSGVRFFDRWDY